MGRNVKVREDEENGRVEIDGVFIRGFVARNRTCDRCRQAAVYTTQYEVYFCPYCEEWLEERCEDPTCARCQARPSRPVPEALV